MEIGLQFSKMEMQFLNFEAEVESFGRLKCPSLNELQMLKQILVILTEYSGSWACFMHYLTKCIE